MVTGSLSRRAGGLFSSVLRLSQSLCDLGLNISVIGLRDPDTEEDLRAWLPLKPIVLDPGFPAAVNSVRAMAAKLDQIQPDVVHQHGLWLPLSSAVSRWASQGKTVISPHGMLDPWALAHSRAKKRIAWIAWERTNLNSASVLHALAQAEEEAIRAVLPKANVKIVPNAVDLPTGRAAARSPGKIKVLLFLGRIHPKKGLAELFKQWAALPASLRETWRLVVVGPDENGHRAQLEKLGAALDISNEINFTGPLTGQAKQHAYEQADAFVLPSHSEGLPMTVLEAWAAGLPVLMTRACNLPQGFEAGAAVEIELGDDPRSLEAALCRADLRDMGLRGLELVEKEFTWDSVAKLHVQTYAGILGLQ